MARARKVPYPSPQEIIATISKSRFPSIVTEGDDDVIVLRRLEDEFADIGLTIIPAGGRDAVLATYELRAMLPSSAQALFIADRDLWVISSVPDHYVSDEILFTDGYSIENDMFVDGSLEELLVGSARANFLRELEIVCSWYAIAANRILRQQDERLDVHPNELFESSARRNALLQLEPHEENPEFLAQSIRENYIRLMRGKTLFALLIRQLPGYNNRTLLNIGASRKGALFKKIVRKVESYFLQNQDNHIRSVA
ncbi:hypothetical protein ACFQS7_25335 [Dankookia sp. GCM10030260]